MIEQMTIEQLLEAYPEGTAEGFAGYCDELSAWQLIVDVTTKLLDDGCWMMVMSSIFYLQFKEINKTIYNYAEHSEICLQPVSREHLYRK